MNQLTAVQVRTVTPYGNTVRRPYGHTVRCREGTVRVSCTSLAGHCRRRKTGIAKLTPPTHPLPPRQTAIATAGPHRVPDPSLSDGVAVVTPRPVPITAARLARILAVAGGKGAFTTVDEPPPTDDPSPGGGRHDRACTSASDPPADSDDPPVPSASFPDDLASLPEARIVATAVRAGASEAEVAAAAATAAAAAAASAGADPDVVGGAAAGDRPLPGRRGALRRAREWWRRHRGAIGKAVLVVVVVAGTAAAFMAGPLGGVLVLALIGTLGASLSWLAAGTGAGTAPAGQRAGPGDDADAPAPPHLA
jgi:hypothetical protein